MGVATTEAPGLDGFDAPTGTERTVSNDAKPDALVGAGQARATVDRKGLREQVLEVVLARTIRIDGLQVDDVARSGRDVLDRQGALDCPAPLVVRMTGRLGATVPRSVVVMSSDRQLGETPSLVDSDVGDEVWSASAAKVVGAVAAGNHRQEG